MANDALTADLPSRASSICMDSPPIPEKQFTTLNNYDTMCKNAEREGGVEREGGEGERGRGGVEREGGEGERGSRERRGRGGEGE